MVWWFLGYHLAYGTEDTCTGGSDCNGFIGNGKDAFMNKAASMAPLGGSGGYYAGWMFQWAFAAAASTIVSGAVAERCQFKAYLAYTAAYALNWHLSATAPDTMVDAAAANAH